jgi:hypothetical protein
MKAKSIVSKRLNQARDLDDLNDANSMATGANEDSRVARSRKSTTVKTNSKKDLKTFFKKVKIQDSQKSKKALSKVEVNQRYRADKPKSMVGLTLGLPKQKVKETIDEPE